MDLATKNTQKYCFAELKACRFAELKAVSRKLKAKAIDVRQGCKGLMTMPSRILTRDEKHETKKGPG